MQATTGLMVVGASPLVLLSDLQFPEHILRLLDLRLGRRRGSAGYEGLQLRQQLLGGGGRHGGRRAGGRDDERGETDDSGMSAPCTIHPAPSEVPLASRAKAEQILTLRLKILSGEAESNSASRRRSPARVLASCTISQPGVLVLTSQWISRLSCGAPPGARAGFGFDWG